MTIKDTDDSAIASAAITEAVNGREALDKLGSEPFDLVLLDVHMPVMGGKVAIQRIRASTDLERDSDDRVDR